MPQEDVPPFGFSSRWTFCQAAEAQMYISKGNLIFREVIYYYCLLTIPLNTRKCEVQAIPTAFKLQ